MGDRTKGPARAKPGQAAPDGGQRPAGDTGSVGHAPQSRSSAEPAARESDPTQGTPERPICSVDGHPCCEFRALIDPHHPAAMITEDAGTEVITRVYFDGKLVDLGGGKGRALCARKPVALRFDKLVGLTIEMTDGWTIWMPSQALRASYRLS